MLDLPITGAGFISFRIGISILIQLIATIMLTHSLPEQLPSSRFLFIALFSKPCLLLPGGEERGKRGLSSPHNTVVTKMY